MKFGLRATIILICSVAIASPAFAGTFVNGGFEDGTFNGWTQGAGYWYGGTIDPSSYLPGGANYDISANKSAIVTPGPDPIVGSLLNRVYNGGYAARVNDQFNGFHVSVVSQSVANYTDPFIYFAWAAVLESAHSASESANFTLQLTDDTTHSALLNLSYNATTNGPIFTQYGGWYYTDWQIEKLDVSGLQGHDFTLTLLGSDCDQGGHAGYVYLDGFGNAPPPPGVPEPGTLVMLGSGTLFAANWLRRRF